MRFSACVLVCSSVVPLVLACGSSSGDDSQAAAGASGSLADSGAGGSFAGAGGARAAAGAGGSLVGSAGSGVSSAGTGGSAGASDAPNCDALGACCTDLDQLGLTTAAACQASASARDNNACFSDLESYGAFCAGPGEAAYACYYDAKGYCNILVSDSSATGKSAIDMVCTETGGTPVASCPSANLVGCCASAVLDGDCYYSNANPPQTKADCTGVWTTVPPS